MRERWGRGTEKRKKKTIWVFEKVISHKKTLALTLQSLKHQRLAVLL